MRQLYEGRIMDHYTDPRHAGTVDDADMSVHVENPHCGDSFTITAAVDDDTFTAIRFDGDGCALSTAAASLLLDELEGATIAAAAEIEDRDVFDMLGIQKDDIAPVRVKCVLLARNGVEEMVDDR
ncbi:MAG: iron-sulfur cluster assembly scaffold protein [Candidatus Nanohaloarchaea archaeon]|nr:iron-sulfur cluster assembly scaffold protein [Candidatus Nanohaloarchaea archaeon]